MPVPHRSSEKHRASSSLSPLEDDTMLSRLRSTALAWSSSFGPLRLRSGTPFKFQLRNQWRPRPPEVPNQPSMMNQVSAVDAESPSSPV